MSTTMRCFHLANFGQPLLPVEQPLPVPTGTQVLLKVLAAGVCHSDLHIQDGQLDLGNGQFASFAARCNLPRTLGHETAGLRSMCWCRTRATWSTCRASTPSPQPRWPAPV